MPASAPARSVRRARSAERAPSASDDRRSATAARSPLRPLPAARAEAAAGGAVGRPLDRLSPATAPPAPQHDALGSSSLTKGERQWITTDTGFSPTRPSLPSGFG